MERDGLPQVEYPFRFARVEPGLGEAGNDATIRIHIDQALVHVSEEGESRFLERRARLHGGWPRRAPDDEPPNFRLSTGACRNEAEQGDESGPGSEDTARSRIEAFAHV